MVHLEPPQRREGRRGDRRPRRRPRRRRGARPRARPADGPATIDRRTSLRGADERRIERRSARSCRTRRARGATRATATPHGELRIVGEHGPDADGDRVGVRAQAMHLGARLVAVIHRCSPDGSRSPPSLETASLSVTHGRSVDVRVEERRVELDAPLALRTERRPELRRRARCLRPAPGDGARIARPRSRRAECRRR